MHDTIHKRTRAGALLAILAFAICLLVSGCGHRSGTTGGFSGTRTTALSGCTEKLSVSGSGAYVQRITNRLHNSTDNAGTWVYGDGPAGSADKGPWLVLRGEVNPSEWCQATAPTPVVKPAGAAHKPGSPAKPGKTAPQGAKPPKPAKAAKPVKEVKKADVLISTRGFDGHLDPELEVKRSSEEDLPPKTTDVRAQIAWFKRHKEWLAPPVMFVILWFLTMGHALKHSKWLWFMFVAFVSCLGVPLYWLFGWWSAEDTGSPRPLPKEPRPADPALDPELERREGPSAHNFEQ